MPDDEEHELNIEDVEDEYYVTCDHSMTKTHYISFFAAVKDNCVEIVKQYPESDAECRFKKSRTKHFLYKFYVYVHKFHQIFFLAVKGNN